MPAVSTSPVAKALREAGYVPLPRLWVTVEQLELILWMAKQNEDRVNDIRGEINRQMELDKA